MSIRSSAAIAGRVVGRAAAVAATRRAAAVAATRRAAARRAAAVAATRRAAAMAAVTAIRRSSAVRLRAVVVGLLLGLCAYSRKSHRRQSVRRRFEAGWRGHCSARSFAGNASLLRKCWLR